MITPAQYVEMAAQALVDGQPKAARAYISEARYYLSWRRIHELLVRFGRDHGQNPYLMLVPHTVVA